MVTVTISRIVTLVHMLIQGNTVKNAPIGLSFRQAVGASVASLILGAGLGGLGSKGKNRIIGSQFADVYVETFDCCGFPTTPPFAVELPTTGGEAMPVLRR